MHEPINEFTDENGINEMLRNSLLKECSNVFLVDIPGLPLDENPLGGTTWNHLNEWLRNQKQPNHFPRPFNLIVFKIMIFFWTCLSMACFNIWLEVYFGIKY